MKEYFDILNENGEFINEVASREDCHKKGLWHKATVVFVVSTDNKKILLQQRSATKKSWPNLWDITAGGHVLQNELGYQSVIRETKEEIGIDIKKEELEFIGATRSIDTAGIGPNKHYNEYYIVHKDINIDDIKLQTEEVQAVKWFNVEDIKNRINDNFKDLTGKYGCWEYLIKYFEFIEK